MMKDWKTTIVTPKTSIMETIRIVNRSTMQIALVVDDQGKLLGTVTDGDIRRAIINNTPLEGSVDQIMFNNPTTMNSRNNSGDIFSLMLKKGLRHIPIVDDSGSVVGLKVLLNMIRSEPKENLVVLMAGGLGKRLQPFTNDCPKPLLEVGGKPILETILESFLELGFYRFYISVNYKAEMIENYFGDGSRWDVEIKYLREDKQLGTAGALSMLPEPLSLPFFIMNGDLLTKLNFNKLLKFHSTQHAKATMVVREYDFEVPYGVVHLKDDILLALDEKPIHRFFVNAGIYVLQPEVIKMIPKNCFFNMTDVFNLLLKKDMKTATFPTSGYWMDVGHIKDLHQANGEYSKIFE